VTVQRTHHLAPHSRKQGFQARYDDDERRGGELAGGEGAWAHPDRWWVPGPQSTTAAEKKKERYRTAPHICFFSFVSALLASRLGVSKLVGLIGTHGGVETRPPMSRRSSMGKVRYLHALATMRC
jgi:hypothetical protein